MHALCSGGGADITQVGIDKLPGTEWDTECDKAHFFLVAPVFHPRVKCPSPRQTPQSSGSLLGAVSAAYWRTSASGTSLSAAGSGGIVRTPRTALQAARWTATANAPHQRRAHPWAAAPRSVPGKGPARTCAWRAWAPLAPRPWTAPAPWPPCCEPPYDVMPVRAWKLFLFWAPLLRVASPFHV